MASLAKKRGAGRLLDERTARLQAVNAQEREAEERERAERAKKTAEDSKRQTEEALTKARAAEAAAKAASKRADNEAEVAQRNLDQRGDHLAQQAWRDHRGLSHMRELLANWAAPRAQSSDRRGWEWVLPYTRSRTRT